jgi:serine/threonine protein kinase/Flp pilus assembly protein TadD
MQTKSCPHGHAVQFTNRVCLTCGWLFPLPEGEILGQWQILDSVRVHDRYFYKVGLGTEECVIAEALEFFQPSFRERLYEDLKPCLDALGMPLLEYAHLQIGSLLFVHTRYPGFIWDAVQNSLRSQLDQAGILADADLRSLFEILQVMGRHLGEFDLVNPSLTAYLCGQAQTGQWYFLEWEYCVPASAELLFPRLYLGYHAMRSSFDHSAQSYNLELMHAAERNFLLECLTGASPPLFYPEPVSVTSFRTFLSSACLRWLESFNQISDPRKLTPPTSFYSSPAARDSLKKSNQLFAEGYALYQAGKLQAAYPSFEQATRQHMLFSQGYYLQALCIRTQDYALFLKLMAQALRVEPLACYFYARAEGHIIHEKVENAVEDLMTALKNQHYFPEAWYLLGSCQERMRQFPLAEMAYKEAYKQCKNPQFSHSLAQLFESRGFNRQAQAYSVGTLSSGMKKTVYTETISPAKFATCPNGHQNALDQGICQRCQQPLGFQSGDQIQSYTILKRLKSRDPEIENATTVYRALNQEGEEVLLKEYFVPDDKKQFFWSRYNYLIQIKHEYIHNISAVFFSENYCYLVYPWQTGETLQEYLERKGAVSEPLGWQILITIASVIVYLQSQMPPLSHGDIKPSNILLTNRGDICLFDLDSCVSIDAEKSYQSVSTFPFSPFEQQNDYQVHPSSDSYALGVTLMTALTGIFPEMFLSYGRKRFYKWEERIPHVSSQLKSIIQGLFDWKIEKRTLISKDLLRQWLSLYKEQSYLPVPEKFAHFQAAFWDVYKADTNQLDEKVSALLLLERSSLTSFLAASRYYHNGEYLKALAVLKNIQKFEDDFENRLWLLGELYLLAGYHSNAVDVLNQSLENYKNNFWPYILLARSYMALKEYRLAFAAYDQAKKNKAPSAFVLEYIGQLLQERYFQKALELAKAQVSFTNLPYERSYLHGAAGIALARLGFENDALPELQESLRWKSDQAQIHFEAGKVCLNLQLLDDARFYLRNCLDLEPENRGAQFFLLRTEIAVHNFEFALSGLLELESTAQTDQELIEILFQKARVLTLLLRMPEAEACYALLLQKRPCESVCVNYGNLCLIIKSFEKARELFMQALKFNPNSTEAKNGLKLVPSRVS